MQPETKKGGPVETKRQKRANLSTLRAELVAAGLVVETLQQDKDDNLLIGTPDGTLVSAIDAVLAAHNPDAASPGQVDEQNWRAQLRTFMQVTDAQWAAATAGQKADALRNGLRGLILYIYRQTP